MPRRRKLTMKDLLASAETDDDETAREHEDRTGMEPSTSQGVSQPTAISPPLQRHTVGLHAADAARSRRAADAAAADRVHLQPKQQDKQELQLFKLEAARIGDIGWTEGSAPSAQKRLRREKAKSSDEDMVDEGDRISGGDEEYIDDDETAREHEDRTGMEPSTSQGVSQIDDVEWTEGNDPPAMKRRRRENAGSGEKDMVDEGDRMSGGDEEDIDEDIDALLNLDDDDTDEEECVGESEEIARDDRLLLAALAKCSSGLSSTSWDLTQLNTIDRIRASDVDKFMRNVESTANFIDLHYCTSCRSSMGTSTDVCQCSLGATTFTVSKCDFNSLFSSVVNRNAALLVKRTEESVNICAERPWGGVHGDVRMSDSFRRAGSTKADLDSRIIKLPLNLHTDGIRCKGLKSELWPVSLQLLTLPTSLRWKLWNTLIPRVCTLPCAENSDIMTKILEGFGSEIRNCHVKVEVNGDIYTFIPTLCFGVMDQPAAASCFHLPHWAAVGVSPCPQCLAVTTRISNMTILTWASGRPRTEDDESDTSPMRGLLLSTQLGYDVLHVEWLGFMKNMTQRLFGVAGSSGFHQESIRRGTPRLMAELVKGVTFIRGPRQIINPSSVKRNVTGFEYYSLFVSTVPLASSHELYLRPRMNIFALCMSVRARLEADFEILRVFPSLYSSVIKFMKTTISDVFRAQCATVKIHEYMCHSITLMKRNGAHTASNAAVFENVARLLKGDRAVNRHTCHLHKQTVDIMYLLGFAESRMEESSGITRRRLIEAIDVVCGSGELRARRKPIHLQTSEDEQFRAILDEVGASKEDVELYMLVNRLDVLSFIYEQRKTKKGESKRTDNSIIVYISPPSPNLYYARYLCTHKSNDVVIRKIQVSTPFNRLAESLVRDDDIQVLARINKASILCKVERDDEKCEFGIIPRSSVISHGFICCFQNVKYIQPTPNFAGHE